MYRTHIAEEAEFEKNFKYHCFSLVGIFGNCSSIQSHQGRLIDDRRLENLLTEPVQSYDCIFLQLISTLIERHLGISRSATFFSFEPHELILHVSSEGWEDLHAIRFRISLETEDMKLKQREPDVR
ncbi:Hypothetical predicted protein [Cloeon dipterum]|uniref:Uncharacterized protein n=1 Tax=Cloeon dipterum TaxID=197152 RepID=A0A8S1CY74_9INSE|nr:Hypothetical predicted protein [Cloeon dipterum]